jgi:SSS family solute:Na+ symporter
MSEYAWYTILGMVLANLVSIIAVAPGMQTAGSAKNEMTARFGMIGGMFFKRFIMIFWALAGLLAIGLYTGILHDPDLIWGYMSKDLLFPGAIGLMLVGILAANMSTLDASAVSYSALFIKNIYQPFKPEKSEKHYLFVGRIAIGATLLGGIAVALYVNNLLELFKYIISIPAIFGASIWLGFIWRRLTKSAVVTQVVLCLIIYAIIPNVFPTLNWAKYNPHFLQETQPKVARYSTSALKKDVEEGSADFVGQSIQKKHVIEPVGVFFESVVRIDHSDPESAKMGLGRSIFQNSKNPSWWPSVSFLTPCFRLFFCFWFRFSQNQHPKRIWIDFMPNFTHRFKKLRMRKGGLCRNLIKIPGNSKRIRSSLAQTGKS